jgi:hypothetical protein
MAFATVAWILLLLLLLGGWLLGGWVVGCWVVVPQGIIVVVPVLETTKYASLSLDLYP